MFMYIIFGFCNTKIWDQQLTQSFLFKADAKITAVTNTVIHFAYIQMQSGFIFLAESMISNQSTVIAVCVITLADHHQLFIQVVIMFFSQCQHGLKAPVVYISYSSRYHYLYCVLSNGDVAIYNSDTSFSLIAVLSLGINVTCALIQDVVVYAGGPNGELAILNMQTNERCIRTFTGVPIKVFLLSSNDLQTLLLISEDPSYALLLVYADGQLSLFNLPDFVLLHSGNVERVYEENKRKGSNVLAATVYKNKKDEWMLISSCQKFSSVRVHLKYHNQDIALSVMAVNAFQPRGLMKQCTSAPVTSLVNIGKRGTAGDYVVAGCRDGSITVFDMSEQCVCL